MTRRTAYQRPGSTPPYQLSTSEREIETPPGRTRVPASASARISSRVNQRASSISEPSTSISVSTARAGEADHQAGRQRPRLAAEVGHLPHLDAGLLLDLAAYGVLHRLARLDEAGERGVAPLGPQRAAPEQRALVGAAGLAVGDDHDHGGVGARELVAAAVGAVQHVPGLPGLERACRSAGSSAWPRATRPGRSRAAPAVRRRWSRRPATGTHGAQHHPLVAVAGRVLRVDDHREVLARRRARRAAHAGRRAPPAARPSQIGRRPAAPVAPAITSTRVAGSAQRSSSQSSSVRSSPWRSWACCDSATCGSSRGVGHRAPRTPRARSSQAVNARWS